MGIDSQSLPEYGTVKSFPPAFDAGERLFNKAYTVKTHRCTGVDVFLILFVFLRDRTA